MSSQNQNDMLFEMFVAEFRRRLQPRAGEELPNGSGAYEQMIMMLQRDQGTEALRYLAETLSLAEPLLDDVSSEVIAAAGLCRVLTRIWHDTSVNRIEYERGRVPPGTLREFEAERCRKLGALASIETVARLLQPRLAERREGLAMKTMLEKVAVWRPRVQDQHYPWEPSCDPRAPGNRRLCDLDDD